MGLNNLSLSTLKTRILGRANILSSRKMRLPDVPISDVRLLIVLERTDYREALSNIFMPEDLYGQLSEQLSPVDLHILTAAVRWSAQVQEVAIFSCQSPVTYSESTYLKVRLSGSGLGESEPALSPSPLMQRKQIKAERELIKQVAEFCPTHVVMCTESIPILRWAGRNKISTVALLFDWSIPSPKPLQKSLSLAQQWQKERLVSKLNQRHVHWVGGKGISISLRMKDSGVIPKKIIPWGWSQPNRAETYPYKKIPIQKEEIKLIYIGSLDASAGIDELLAAIVRLQKSNYRISLQLIYDTLNQMSPVNSEATAWLEEQVQNLGIAKLVNVWAGLSPEQMLARVHAADLVVIPQPSSSSQTGLLASSHLEFDLSKSYQVPVPPPCVTLAMAAHTPIVACDHPSLEAYLYHNANAVIFPTGNSQSMAHRIERVMGQPALYAQLSEASDLTLDQIKIPARWDELIDRWLRDRPYDQQQLADFALTSGRYSPS